MVVSVLIIIARKIKFYSMQFPSPSVFTNHEQQEYHHLPTNSDQPYVCRPCFPVQFSFLSNSFPIEGIFWQHVPSEATHVRD